MFPVPASVVAAFGAEEARLHRLPGGQERTWTDDQIVLKPVDNPVEHVWVSDVFAAWPDDAEVGVPMPVPAPDGSWLHDGWAAHRFVPGRSARMTWEPELIRAAGGQVITDESSSGGQHVYVPFAVPIGFHQARDIALALAARTPTMDPSPNQNLTDGLIRPSGSAHPNGGH